MNRDLWKFIGAIVAMLAIIGFVLFLVGKYLIAENSSHGQSAMANVPQSDVIIAPSSAGSSQSVMSASGGYAFAVPSAWYVEPEGARDAEIYPDYSPNTSSTAQCKIEISVFENASGVSFGDWIKNKLSEDPTLDVSETSEDSLTVGGESGIHWSGTIDDVQTDLTYVSANGKIYEFAPSALSAASGELSSATTTPSSTVEPCADDLNSLLNSFRFTP